MLKQVIVVGQRLLAFLLERCLRLDDLLDLLSGLCFKWQNLLLFNINRHITVLSDLVFVFYLLDRLLLVDVVVIDGLFNQGSLRLLDHLVFHFDLRFVLFLLGFAFAFLLFFVQGVILPLIIDPHGFELLDEDLLKTFVNGPSASIELDDPTRRSLSTNYWFLNLLEARLIHSWQLKHLTNLRGVVFWSHRRMHLLENALRVLTGDLIMQGVIVLSNRAVTKLSNGHLGQVLLLPL